MRPRKKKIKNTRGKWQEFPELAQLMRGDSAFPFSQFQLEEAHREAVIVSLWVHTQTFYEVAAIKFKYKNLELPLIKKISP